MQSFWIPPLLAKLSFSLIYSGEGIRRAGSFYIDISVENITGKVIKLCIQGLMN
ncbi:hypothetical protein Scep_005525 [Stephania cephalantha]|uniref:Uncharacterized protein n=1 Tax=Stephania cephalantha TaxID=152367 RepID=A0AAP0Q068_9MAGN